jgi:hypothetical protein
MRFPIIPSSLTEFIKVPHLQAHLNKEVDHGSLTSLILVKTVSCVMPFPIIHSPLTEFVKVPHLRTHLNAEVDHGSLNNHLKTSKNCAIPFPIIQTPLTKFIKVPHLRAHLNEEVDHGSRRSEDHLRVGGHHPAGHSVTLKSELNKTD